METIDWGYAISTLIIRFVGIFIVLGILQVIMQITGRIFAHRDARKVRQPANTSPHLKGLTQEEVAAVGMALYLHEETE